MNINYFITIIVLLFLFSCLFNIGSVTGYFVYLGEGKCDCNSCSDCIDALNDPNCNIVYLTNDIIDYSETCINNPENFSNKIFDCRGNLIDGSFALESSGIYLENKTNATIKNCSIKNFYFAGILLNNTNLSNIIFNNISDNGIHIPGRGYSISIFNSSHNIIENNYIYNTTDAGIINTLSSNNNIIANNNISYSGDFGIYIG
ncbi:MAG: right-handed parallel beta-helix repeat-containing protein, partial [Candidatus Goldbacteria bacterium]|nr:right-handed parallel beta-helix repeat-containing protein [Candidatus Goldiibacteriota bacterium]